MVRRSRRGGRPGLEPRDARARRAEHGARGRRLVGDVIVTWRATTDDEDTELRFFEGFESGTVAVVRGEEEGWQTAVLERPSEADRLSEVLVVIDQ